VSSPTSPFAPTTISRRDLTDHDVQIQILFCGNAYINFLRRDGNLTMVGAPEKALPVAVFGLMVGRRSFSGSPIGGIPEPRRCSTSAASTI
jgi:hypothetical protein